MSDEKEQQAFTTARELQEIALIIEGHDAMLAWLNRLGYVVVDKRPNMWGVIGEHMGWLAENLTYSAAIEFALNYVLQRATAVAAGISEVDAAKCPRLDGDHDGVACYGN